MKKEFDEYVKKGGKVTTIKYGDNKYRHICKIDGKICSGDIKPKKKEK